LLVATGVFRGNTCGFGGLMFFAPTALAGKRAMARELWCLYEALLL